jgi:hypothetical protein
MHITLWLENLKERDHSEDLGVDGKIILAWILGKWSGKVWILCFRVRIGTSDSNAIQTMTATFAELISVTRRVEGVSNKLNMGNFFSSPDI